MVAAGPATLGVEEEFALLEPQTGHVSLVAPGVIRDCDERHSVVAESMTYMVESRTPVCRTLDDVQRSLCTSRQRVAKHARRLAQNKSLKIHIAPGGVDAIEGVDEEMIRAAATTFRQLASLMDQQADLLQRAGATMRDPLSVVRSRDE